MFALLAALAFIVALFKRSLGPVDMVTLGLLFLTLHVGGIEVGT